VTLPGRALRAAACNPATRTLERIEQLFRSIGFDVADGPEIETDFHNFTALNQPPDHPARSMHDTFYLKGAGQKPAAAHAHLADPGALHATAQSLRSRSSPPAGVPRRFGRDAHADVPPGGGPLDRRGGQLRRSQKAFSPISCASLRRREAAKRAFGRLFSPFTEPSAEVDMSCVFCGGAGCRVCGQNRLARGSRQRPSAFPRTQGLRRGHEKYMGFAFGMGPDRLTMLRYGYKRLATFLRRRFAFSRPVHVKSQKAGCAPSSTRKYRLGARARADHGRARRRIGRTGRTCFQRGSRRPSSSMS